MSKLDQLRALRERQSVPAAIEPIPALFAVYRCTDSDGELLYVGQSISPLQRLIDEHARRYAGRLANVAITWHSTRAAALAAEADAIRSDQPSGNRSAGITVTRMRLHVNSDGKFDRRAYQREYMMKRRAAAKAAKSAPGAPASGPDRAATTVR